MAKKVKRARKSKSKGFLHSKAGFIFIIALVFAAIVFIIGRQGKGVLGAETVKGGSSSVCTIKVTPEKKLFKATFTHGYPSLWTFSLKITDSNGRTIYTNDYNSGSLSQGVRPFVSFTRGGHYTVTLYDGGISGKKACGSSFTLVAPSPTPYPRRVSPTPARCIGQGHSCTTGRTTCCGNLLCQAVNGAPGIYTCR